MRRNRLFLGGAQLLLVIAAGGLWAASRLPWVAIRSFDGLGPPKELRLSGGTWSTALLPLAILLLAAAVAALAVRGWRLRGLAALLALASFAVGYLGLSLWVVPDVAVRGAELVHIPLMTLVGSGRHYWGAAITVASAVCTLVAATLLMRSASLFQSGHPTTIKYATPAARRSLAQRVEAGEDTEAVGPASTPDMSERMIWDALDEGHDPTDRPKESDTEGR
nr:TIGR02234 family membrane protein [Mycobacterium basiliense]